MLGWTAAAALLLWLTALTFTDLGQAGGRTLLRHLGTWALALALLSWAWHAQRFTCGYWGALLLAPATAAPGALAFGPADAAALLGAACGAVPQAPQFAAAAVLGAGLLATACFLGLVSKRTLANTGALRALALLLFAGAVFTSSSSLALLALSFELLLGASLYLLLVTAKSDRASEACGEMAAWALVGSLYLYAGVAGLGALGVYTLPALGATPAAAPLLLFFLLAFGVKVPLWPATSWLLRAHVEASVEFSILLSGFIVKLGAWGLYTFLAWAPTAAWSHLVVAWAAFGVVTAVSRLFSQRDLKRVVALLTVAETNWLAACLALGGPVFTAVGFYLVVAHAFTTALGFLFVECVSRRWGTRDWPQLAGVAAQTPLLWAASMALFLMLIGFPGTPLFVAKVAFLTALWPLSAGWTCVFALLLVLAAPLALARVWLTLWFGQPGPRAVPDLTGAEAALFAALVVGATLLSFWPALLPGLLDNAPAPPSRQPRFVPHGGLQPDAPPRPHRLGHPLPLPRPHLPRQRMLLVGAFRAGRARDALVRTPRRARSPRGPLAGPEADPLAPGPALGHASPLTGVCRLQPGKKPQKAGQGGLDWPGLGDGATGPPGADPRVQAGGEARRERA